MREHVRIIVKKDELTLNVLNNFTLLVNTKKLIEDAKKLVGSEKSIGKFPFLSFIVLWH